MGSALATGQSLLLRMYLQPQPLHLRPPLGSDISVSHFRPCVQDTSEDNIKEELSKDTAEAGGENGGEGKEGGAEDAGDDDTPSAQVGGVMLGPGGER